MRTAPRRVNSSGRSIRVPRNIPQWASRSHSSSRKLRFAQELILTATTGLSDFPATRLPRGVTAGSRRHSSWFRTKPEPAFAGAQFAARRSQPGQGSPIRPKPIGASVVGSSGFTRTCSEVAASLRGSENRTVEEREERRAVRRRTRRERRPALLVSAWLQAQRRLLAANANSSTARDLSNSAGRAAGRRCRRPGRRLQART